MPDMRRGARNPDDGERPASSHDDERRQPWPGSDPGLAIDPHDPDVPPSEQRRPDPSGVRSGRDDDSVVASDGSGARRPVDVNEALPPQSVSPDELSSEVAPDDPGAAREDVGNTSDSSGLRAGDEADGERIRELHRRGATEISKMD